MSIHARRMAVFHVEEFSKCVVLSVVSVEFSKNKLVVLINLFIIFFIFNFVHFYYLDLIFWSLYISAGTMLAISIFFSKFLTSNMSLNIKLPLLLLSRLSLSVFVFDFDQS